MKTTFTICILILFLNPLISGQNNPPIAVNDTVYCFPGYTYRLNILANDYDPDGDSIYVSYCQVPQINDSTWEFTLLLYDYSVGSDYQSVKTFNYQIKDANGTPSPGKIVYIYKYPPSFEFADANNINALISPFGNHFWDFTHSCFEAPKGSGKKAVFNQSLWLGGYNQHNQLRFAGEKYRAVGKDFLQGPISSIIDSSYFKLWNHVWKINKEEIRNHINNWNNSGYSPIDVIADWPAHGDTTKGESYHIAPFYDMDGDGHYDPMHGDYPLIRGDQAVFFVFNDSTIIHTESAGFCLGIEIHGMAYEFDKPEDSALNNTLFFHLDIMNKSVSEYQNTFLTIFTDFDLGNNLDDYIGTDVTHGMVYAYNGTEVDGEGESYAYGAHPPAIGMCILGGPYMDADGTDNPDTGCGYNTERFNFGDGIADNERFGLCGSNSQFNYPPSWYFEDDFAINYYSYMCNLFRDGVHLNFGGSGRPDGGSVGPDCMYIYPGNSDTLCNFGTGGVMPNGGYNQNGYYWTEGTVDNAPGDRRMIANIGPFTFQVGQSLPLDYCFIFARDYQGTNLTSVDLLQQYSEEITSQAGNLTILPGTYYSVKENDKSGKLKVIPNPVTDNVRIFYTEASTIPFLVSDINGQVRKSGNLANGTADINLNDLKPGIYIIRSGSCSAKIVKL